MRSYEHASSLEYTQRSFGLFYGIGGFREQSVADVDLTDDQTMRCAKDDKSTPPSISTGGYSP